jgi:opacity protein-like surface antigen
MKKLLIAVTATALMSTSAQAADTSDVVAGVIGGIILGKVIDNHDHRGHSRRHRHEHYNDHYDYYNHYHYNRNVPNAHITIIENNRVYELDRRGFPLYNPNTPGMGFGRCDTRYRGYDGCSRARIEEWKRR